MSADLQPVRDDELQDEIPRSGRKKMLLRLVLLGIVGVVGLAVLGGFGTLLSLVTTSGNTAEVFTDAAELPEELLDSVTWLPDDEGLPRPMEPLTRLDVTSAWIRAWSQLTVAAETGDTIGMEVYFSNDALRAVLAGAENASGRPVFQIGHDLRLTFYSEDGQVIGLTGERIRLLRAEPFTDGRRRFFETEESYEAVLVLEDGNWRIQHWVRRSVAGEWLVGDGAPQTVEVIAGAVEPIPELRIAGMVGDSSHGALSAGELPTDEDIVDAVDTADADLALAAAVADEESESELGAGPDDAVRLLRLPIGFAEMGGSTPSDEGLEALELALDEATERDLSIVVSLFDGRTSFTPSRWQSDRLHIDAIRDAVGDHQALASLELGFADALESDLAQAWVVSMNSDLVGSGLIGNASELVDFDEIGPIEEVDLTSAPVSVGNPVVPEEPGPIPGWKLLKPLLLLGLLFVFARIGSRILKKTVRAVISRVVRPLFGRVVSRLRRILRRPSADADHHDLDEDGFSEDGFDEDGDPPGMVA